MLHDVAPTIDKKRVAVDKRSIVGGEERNRAGDLMGLSEPSPSGYRQP